MQSLTADFAHQRKSAKCACQIFADLHTLAKCGKCTRCTLFQKRCAPGLHKVCRVCTCSAPSLHINRGFFPVSTGGFSGKKNRLIKMNIQCILNADSCRHHADIVQTSIQVCIWRTFLFSYAKYAQGKSADMIHTLCRLVKTLCRLDADYITTCTSGHLTQCFVIIRQVCTW